MLGSDFSEGMLTRARAKAVAGRGARPSEKGHQGNAWPADVKLRFEWGDALELPYPDASFDAATVGFGARNFAELSRGLAEMVRVVRPGGRVVVLEFTTPTKPPLSLFYRLWFDRLVPLLGAMAGYLARAGGRRGREGASGGTIADAYSYLPNSVKRFPSPALLAAELERAGLCEIGYLLTAGGIVTIHTGTVPHE